MSSERLAGVGQPARSGLPRSPQTGEGSLWRQQSPDQKQLLPEDVPLLRWLSSAGWAERGQGITEYVLLLALLVIAMVGAVSFTGLGSALTSVLAGAISRVASTLDALVS